MKSIIQFFLICIFLTIASPADAKRITINIPENGAPTHNGGTSINSLVRDSAHSCSVQVVFNKKPRFLLASFVGRPFSTGSGEAPALVVTIAQPTSDGKSYIFGCYTTNQIFYKDTSNNNKSTIALESRVNSGATLNLDVDF